MSTMRQPVRTMIPPPPDRPFWLRDSNEDLLYLGWGRRYYHRQPIPIVRHLGWSYLVILTGRPRLALVDREIAAPAGTLFLVGPDCASSWRDNPGRSCTVLAWIWRTPPPNAPLSGALHTGLADRDGLLRLEHLHRESRREVATSDQHSNAALRALRSSLDIEYARTLRREPKSALSERQLAWAINWMRHHLDNKQPVQALSEYLDMTSADVGRLFGEGTSKSPVAYFQTLRMSRAAALLRDGQQAKTVAQLLGYQHANDLSRAFQRHFGHTIRAALHDAAHRSNGGIDGATQG